MSERKIEVKQVEQKLCVHGKKTCDRCLWSRGYPAELLKDNQNIHTKHKGGE